MLYDDDTKPMRRKQAFQFLRTTVRDLKNPYLIFFVTTLVVSASSFLLPQFFLMFTEEAATLSETTISTFLPKFLLFGLCVAVILALTTFANNYMREWFQLKIERHLRTKVLARLHHMSISEIDRVQRGDWLTSVTDDLRAVERFIAESLPGQVRAMLVVLGTGVIFIYYSHAMAAVPIIACVLIALLNVWVQRRIMPLLDDIRDLHGNVIQSLLQSLEGAKTIRSYGAERDQVGRFSQQLADVEHKGLRVARAFGLLVGGNDAATQVLTTLSLTFIMLALSKGDMPLAAALAYPFYLNLFYSSAETLASSTLDWNEFFVSGGRFAEIARERGLERVAAKHVEPRFLENVERVELRGVSFGYSVKRPLKTAYDFSYRRNEIVAILGPSGAGKSTFLEVLSGIRPPFTGHWQLHANGRGESDFFAHASFPREIAAYVEQKPYIFEGSILDNLLLGSDRSPESVWDVLADVNLSDFVEECGGLEAFLQDGGQNLSEGQRYRLALARALLAKRPFLLLDEPFAALDHVNAALVCETLERCKSQCGVILVTHTIPAALQPDRVVDFVAGNHGTYEAIPRVRVDGRVEFERFL